MRSSKVHRTSVRTIIASGILAAILAPASASASVHCGVLEYSHMDGANSVFKGIGYGCVRVVLPGGALSSYNVVPGRLYVLKPGQGFNCSC
jgi:hypothetical protein